MRFASATFPGGAMLSHTGEATPTTVWGELRLPRTPAGPGPGVVLLHGAGGVTANLDEWAGVLEYQGALHGFDLRAATGVFQPRVVSGRDCVYVERTPGVFDVTHRSDGRVAHPGDRCISRGITTGYDPRAHAQSVEDVRRFLSDALALPGGARHRP